MVYLGEKHMLTDVQKGMIEFCIRFRLEKLVYYFIKFERNVDGYSKIARILQEAQAEEYVGEHYTRTSDKTNIHASIPIIRYELWGILHSNFDILNRLFIVNNPRDSVRIAAEHLREIAHDITNYAAEVLRKLVHRYPEVKDCLTLEANSARKGGGSVEPVSAMGM